MPHNLPQSDGTTSTNFGAPFGIYTTALLALRCCRNNKEMQIMINNNKYSPWHDLVLHHQDQTVCILITHESELKNKKKFKTSLDQRQKIIDEHDGSLSFARLAVALDDGLKKRFPKATEVPEALSLVLTSNDSVYVDKNGSTSTYFCMEQHDVSVLEVDVENALLDYIGRDFISKSQLRKVQTIFLEFIQNRFYRLIEPNSPMTVDEVRKHLSHAILGLFKVPCAKVSGKKTVEGDLRSLLKENVVVLNHSPKSVVKQHVWRFLRMVYQDLGDLKQSVVDSMWFLGRLHMPLTAPDEKTDKLILRALQMGDFDAKVLLLRARVFAYKEIGPILTILQGVVPLAGVVKLRVDADEEVFKWAELQPNRLKSDATHRDLFGRLAQGFGFEQVLVEAHDEFSSINDQVVVAKEPLTALIAAIKTPGVDISVVRMLIELGANVDTMVIGGHGPVYFAVQADRPDIAELLLERGAKPDLADKYGNVPLFYACTEEKTSVVEVLLKYNSNRNAADYYGVTPMFMAYGKKNYEMLTILLRGHENPTAADPNGSHLLHRAAKDGDVNCLRCVLETVPDVNVFMVGDYHGLTPIDIAQENDHAQFVDLLEKALQNHNK